MSNNSDADNIYKAESDNAISFNGNTIATIKFENINLNDTGCGITDKVLYYREEGATGNAANGTSISNDGIAVSGLTDGTTYEIFAKDNWGNETVFKTITPDKTGPDINSINVGEYGFYKDGANTPVAANNGYTVLDATADGTIEFKYNTGLKKFKVSLTTSESGVSIKKVIGTNNPADYDGSINLGNSAEIKLIAVDSLWNETIVRKYKFTVDSTQTLSNINGISTAGIIPAGTTKSSVVKLNSGTSDNSRSGARFIQFFNNVQNVFTRNNEYEETSYNPAANAEAVELPVAETKKKSAKRTSAKPADVVAAVTEMATSVTEKGSVSEVELPLQVEELTETVEQSVTPVAEAVEPAPVTSSEDFVTQSTPSSVLPFLILLLVFGAFGSFVLMFIRKIKK